MYGHVVTVPGGEHQTALLVFLTTTCKTCAPLWDELASAPPGALLGAQLVVVTPSPAMEDRSTAQRMLPPGALLHMDSGTWFAYGVLQAGTFLLARYQPTGAVPWVEPAEVLGLASVTHIEELEPLLSRWMGHPAPPTGA